MHKGEDTDHIWDPIRDKIDVPTLWTRHRAFHLRGSENDVKKEKGDKRRIGT